MLPCVSASKSRSPSPEKEFVPPTFETVVVTRQPKKSSKTAEHQEHARRSAGGNDDGDDDDDDDDDIVSKCDDFEKYAQDENADSASIHYVEATAVRTLAANTGSVAILGTTAKCKSAGSSPAVRQSPVDRQQTWSPTTSQQQPQQPKSPTVQQPQLETRYVEATAVRTLAAETGSIAILGTTADPKAKRTAAEKKPDDDAGSIHYVEATAVRHLAAETGSIAILASTAAVSGVSQSRQQPPQTPQPPPPAESTADVVAGPDHDPDADRIPVGVREVLDSEPGAATGPPDTEPEQRDLPDDVDPQIPLPVIYAMEMKPTAENALNTATSPSDTRSVSPPRSATVDDGLVAASSDSSTRKPLLRQSNKTSEQKENDDDVALSSDTWMPSQVPVFAKCPPAKSKSKYMLCLRLQCDV